MLFKAQKEEKETMENRQKGHIQNQAYNLYKSQKNFVGGESKATKQHQQNHNNNHYLLRDTWFLKCICRHHLRVPPSPVIIILLSFTD